MKLLIMQFSPSFCYSISLSPNLLLCTLFSVTVNLYSSLEARVHEFHAHTNKGKIYIFMFLHRRWELKRTEETPETELSGRREFIC
jgi:hypothetical protein